MVRWYPKAAYFVHWCVSFHAAIGKEDINTSVPISNADIYLKDKAGVRSYQVNEKNIPHKLREAA